MSVKDKRYFSYNTGKWTQLEIIPKIPGQHTGRAGNQGTTEKSYIGHCKHTSKITAVKIQNIQHGK